MQDLAMQDLAMQDHAMNDSKDYESIWQDYISDVAWGTIVLFFGLVIGYVIVISSALEGLLPYPIAGFLCGCLAYASFTVLHDAGHGSIVSMSSPLKPLEPIMAWIASLTLLVLPFRFFQAMHDRHHAFTNDPDRDPDHFIFGDKWYQVLANTLYVPVQYHIMSVTSKRHVKNIRRTYPSTIVYMVLVWGSLISLMLNGYLLEVASFVLIPNVIALVLLVMVLDYLPHHPHKSMDPYHDSRIYPGKLVKILTFGHSYHLIHHLYPKLPWYRYEEVYQRILPLLEERNAPIEDIGGGIRPGFLSSPNTTNLLDGGKSINMVLDVAKVETLTSDAVAVTFELPAGEKLEYKAGQYITVSKLLDGQQQTRCYSLCNSPNKGELKIGVRHTFNGAMSGFINKELEQGDELIVQGPFGDFAYPSVDNTQNIEALVLVAGGSGITPILSIMQTALDDNSSIPVHLVYTSRSKESIMFFEQIEQLKARYSERLKVSYFIGDGEDVRLNPARFTSLLPVLADDKATASSGTEFYICGPEGLKNMLVQTLAEQGYDQNAVHVEEFVASTTEPVGEMYPVEITLENGQQHSLKVASNQTVLEVANSQGVKIDHACGRGNCGSCRIKVDAGSVDAIPDSLGGITSEEKASGYTLACQCRPLSSLSLSC